MGSANRKQTFYDWRTHFISTVVSASTRKSFPLGGGATCSLQTDDFQTAKWSCPQFADRGTLGQSTLSPWEKLIKMESRIDFGIKSNTLCVESITNLLGITPTSSFNPNERYMGKTKVGRKIISVERNRPSFGVWHYETRKKITDNSIDENACHLLKVLEPACNEIEKMLKNKDYELAINIWYTGPAGFIISSETLSRLTKICKDLYIICFEEEDAFYKL